MRTILRVVAMATFVLAGVTFAAEKPTYNEGEQWVFKSKGNMLEFDGEYHVTYKGGKFESSDMQFLTSAFFVTVHLDDPQKKWLEFPLIAGNRWRFRYQHRSAASGIVAWRNSEVQVVGAIPQPLKTPAGEFKVIEIRRTDFFGKGRIDLSYFYSSETKSVVKLVGDAESPSGAIHAEMELIKYSTP